LQNEKDLRGDQWCREICILHVSAPTCHLNLELAEGMSLGICQPLDKEFSKKKKKPLDKEVHNDHVN
jgi:hypothetical protein